MYVYIIYMYVYIYNIYIHYKLIIDNDKKITTLDLLLQVSRYQNPMISNY